MQLTVPGPVGNFLTKTGLANIKQGFSDAVGNVVIVEPSALGSLVGFLQTILLIFALMLMFQRNKGFNLGAFLAACYCSPYYLAYALASPKGNQRLHF